MQDPENDGSAGCPIPDLGIAECFRPSTILAVIFEEMQVWVDDVARSGPEAMAIDEWLLESIDCPVLRVYSWQGNWGSIGYFSRFAEARATFPDLNLVRRWTGGGIVDHRVDWTYTLAVPKSESLAELRGNSSYQLIHEKLAEVINNEQYDVRLELQGSTADSNICFNRPVMHDLVDFRGRKLAGAGQRRTRLGLLHQGSVACPCSDSADFRIRAENLAMRLAGSWSEFRGRPQIPEIQARIAARYDRSEWLHRR